MVSASVSARKAATSAPGSNAKASSVGAKTVRFADGAISASVSSASSTRSISVENEPSVASATVSGGGPTLGASSTASIT